MQRRLIAISALAVVLGGAPPAPAQARVESPRNPSFQVVPALPQPGEVFVVRGTLPDRGRRPVQLQRRDPGGPWRWAAGTTSSASGRYSIAYSTRLPALVVRVVAPRTGARAAVRTAPVVVRPTAPTTSLSLAGDREHVVATATVRPVRAGRPLRLQAYRQGWRTIAVRQQTGAQVSWQVPDPGGLPTAYRVVAAAWKGADLFRGAARTFAAAAVPTGLPRITLTTDEPDPVIDRETYLAGTLQVDDGPRLATQLRGRGNGTWKWPKKPFRIKLGAKSPLLGMPSERDWVLLANFADRSLVRTWTAFGIAEQTSLAWTPQARFVDVTLNGVDLGSYQLVEQVEESAQKVQLLEGGLLLEVDNYYPVTGDPGFTTAQGTPIGFKDPDDPTAEQQAAVAADLAAFESALYGPSFTDPVAGYAQYVDLTSFADWYLVNEAMKNIDGDMYSSAFVTWDPAASRFTMGPVWDFDQSSGYASPGAPGCCAATDGWWLRGHTPTGRVPHHATHWLTRMAQDPAFLAFLEERWSTVVRSAVLEGIAALPAQRALLARSAALDWVTWRDGFAPAPGTAHATDHPGEVDHLVSWLTARVAWLDSELGAGDG